MYLTAMTHRDELFNLTLRWMNDDFHPDDGERITRIFVYESALSAIALGRVMGMLGRFWNTASIMKRVRYKHQLREQIIATLGITTPRVAELAHEYHANPKYYFPYLPLDALVITDALGRLRAIGRIKRMTRIAEKVSFRLVSALLKEIRTKARHLAEQRAEAVGVSLDFLISSETAMQEDFVRAEEAVAHSFMDKTIHLDPESLAINDILGLKIIAPMDELNRIPEFFSGEPGVAIREIERHSGNYNAVNLLLDIELPEPHLLEKRLQGMDWDIALRRGLNPDAIRAGVADYVRHGSRTVRVELILTTPEELMEAEFGRSIHELRVLRLRQRQEYNGPLGQNAGYLVEYMLALAASPTTAVPEIPIKMYGRYLPEEITSLKCLLHGRTIDDGLLGTFCLHQGYGQTQTMIDHNGNPTSSVKRCGSV